jgi:hypothetical protein
MTGRRANLISMAVTTATILAAVTLVAQGGEKYTARLGWVPITAQERPGVAGKGSVTGTLAGSKLTINGTFEGLVSPATAARLHRGIAKGARGPSVTDLTITKGTSGTITGSADLSAADVENLKSGKLYVQVHSEKGVAPDGANLWGWLLK